MIESWMPILDRWHRDMRLNYPKFWHLQTVYVAAFSVLASVAVAILTIFIPERPDYITPIEPGFLLLLATCIGVTARWVRNFLRPLTWKQISRVAVAPGFTITVIHGAALLVPAFIYGALLEYRIEKVMLPRDVGMKLSLLTAYKDAAGDLNLAALLNKKDNVPEHFWRSVWKTTDTIRNPIDKFNKYIKEKSLSPYLSKQTPAIYYHYYDAYWSADGTEDVLALFKDLDLPDEGDGFTKNKAWECMLWHGLFRAISHAYSPSGRKRMHSVDNDPLPQDIPINLAIHELALSEEAELDILNVIGDHTINIRIGSQSDVPSVHPLIKKEGVARCNPTIARNDSDGGTSFFRWEGIISGDEKTLSGFIQFIKKIVVMYGDHGFFVLNSAPLKGWPLAKLDITDRSAQLKNEYRTINLAIINLSNASYALQGTPNNEKFPWFKNWYWFGSKWMPLICLFILSSLLIGCFIARNVEADELAVAGMICALIIGPYIAFANTFGGDAFFYLALRCSLIGFFLLMFGASIAAVYRQRVGIRWRWTVAATGLVLPFATLSVIAWITQECTDFGCGSRTDIRLPILAAGWVVLLVVGEAYLFLLERAVIKPR